MNNEEYINFDIDLDDGPEYNSRYYKIGKHLYFDPVKPSRYSGEDLRHIRKYGQDRERARRLIQLKK